jgi:hypothetical protein
MKVKVCQGCGHTFFAVDGKGKPSCPICFGIDKNSGVPIEVELPKTFTCSSCKKEAKTEDILKQYVSIPFANPTEGIYYCGCRGWD